MEKEKVFKYWKKRLKDRYDGWRVTKVDAVFSIIPYILRTRVDSQNYYEERIPIDHIEKFIRDNKETIPNLSIMHIVMAAMVRLMSQRPRLNRFVINNKIYARNHITFSLVVKRSITENGEETLIKPHFLPSDTLKDIVDTVQTEYDKVLSQKNDSEKISKMFGYLPSWLIRTIVWFFYRSDERGWLPKLINRVSPWHCSMFLTNIGSIGVESIYHHLYEFGTCSIFLSMGKKSTNFVPDKDGNISREKSILLRFVLDERVCDGYYYSFSMRELSKILANPQSLLTPPEKIVLDDGVDGPLLYDPNQK